MKKLLTVLSIVTIIGWCNQAIAQTPDWAWAKSAGGTNNDQGYSTATDVAGNVFVVGFFKSPDITFGTTTLNNANAGSVDIFIVKYDANGNVLWANSAGGTDSDYGFGIATDATGNVFVTGEFASPSITFGTTTLTNTGGLNVFIVKYDASGNVLWAKSADGFGGYGVSADAAGNVFMSGYFSVPTITFDTTTLTNAGVIDIFIVKYDLTGNVLWAKSEGGTSKDYAFNLCTDASGNVFITGQFSSTTITIGTTVLTNVGGDDVLTVKYDASGNVLWANSAGGAYADYAYSMASDASGNVFVIGTFAGPDITFGNITLNNSGYFIVNYDPNGNVLWANSIGSIPMAVTTDLSGNVLVTGWFSGAAVSFGSTILTSVAGSQDIYILKYDANGNIVWAIGAGGNNADAAYGISTNAGGSLFITGSYNSDTLTFGTTTLTNVSDDDFYIANLDYATSIELTENTNVISIYPNPAKDKLTISNMLWAKGEMVTVTITDITGKIIYSSTTSATQKLAVNTNDFTEGVYLVQIQTENFIQTKKVIIAK